MRAKIILLHALHEHGARYKPLIDTLLAYQFAVYTFDYQGNIIVEEN